jgi:hypothetical protein
MQESKSGGSLMELSRTHVGHLTFEKAVYSVHMCCHGIEFHNVTTPDGYNAQLYGLIACSCHDSCMLSCSNLLLQLHKLMPPGQGTIYSFFGNPEYLVVAHLYSGITQPAPGSNKVAWNTKMLLACIMVEWAFV